jgi:hypothetical protein
MFKKEGVCGDINQYFNWGIIDTVPRRRPYRSKQ